MISGRWDKKVRKKLLEVLTPQCDSSTLTEHSPLAVFDLDQTCLRGDIGYLFFWDMVKNLKLVIDNEKFRERFLKGGHGALAEKAIGILERIKGGSCEQDSLTVEFYKCITALYERIKKASGPAQCFRWMSELLIGWKIDDVYTEALRIFSENLKKPIGKVLLYEDGSTRFEVPCGIRVYDEIKSLISYLKGSGFDVWIVSATSQPIVQVAAEFVGVDSKNCIGIKFKIGAGGIIIGTEGIVTYGRGKVEAIEKWIGKEIFFAAGDCQTDIEMLESAKGIALLIYRGGEDLLKLAEEKGWLVQKAFEID